MSEWFVLTLKIKTKIESLDMRNSEYDSFGPWIYEISEDYPVPELFIKYVKNSEQPIFSIKIPRQIERRKARPGMPLYDYVINLYKTDILILKRDGDKIISNSYLYEKIECIQNQVDLLKGNLRIVMSDLVYNLPYNTVSENIIIHMLEIIRQWYTVGSSCKIPEDSIVDTSKILLSFYFDALVDEEKIQNPGFKILSYQEESSVSLYEKGVCRKLQNRLLGKKLLESLHLSDGRELIIISRGIPFKRRNQAVYSKETYYVPINKIKGIVWKDDQRNSAISNMTIITSNNSYKISFHGKNISIPGYDLFLRKAIKIFADSI